MFACTLRIGPFDAVWTETGPVPDDLSVIPRRRSPFGLPLLGGAQVGGDGVVLDGLVQHQSQKPGSVGHRRPEVPLLLEELVQLVPLAGRQADARLHSGHFLRRHV